MCYIFQAVDHCRKYHFMLNNDVMWKRYGEDFSYDLWPRAKILRRDQARVYDLTSLKRIMSLSRSIIELYLFCFQTSSRMLQSDSLYSDYQRELYCMDCPCKTICCRNELRLKGHGQVVAMRLRSEVTGISALNLDFKYCNIQHYTVIITLLLRNVTFVVFSYYATSVWSWCWMLTLALSSNAAGPSSLNY